jgi:hypothetical protein
VFWCASAGILRLRDPNGALLQWPDQNQHGGCFITMKDHFIYSTFAVMVDDTAAIPVGYSELELIH